MSYIVKQKIGEGIYAYEVQSYWDSNKKQARQKRRYLGIWDESNGQIIPKESMKDIKTTKSFGSVYFLETISKEIDLRTKLVDAFGKDGDSILAMAMSKMLCQTSLKNMHHVLDDSFIPEMYSLNDSFSSQRLSNFLERLSLKTDSIASFYSSLMESENETLVFDITSLSSASRNIDWLEYGYNRDRLDLPQVNLGLVLSIHRKIPLYFKLFPGSINDVVTLKNLVAEIKAFGISKSLFILDRGFYSESNIMEMNAEGIDFILPLPFGIKIGKGLISETTQDIENPANARRFGGEIFYVLESEVEIGGIIVYGYILFNKRREASETRSFFNRLMDIESKLNEKKVYGKPLELFERTAGNFVRYFECSVKSGIISLRRRSNAISQVANRFGKTILLSATKRNWDEVLSLYRERDAIEKEFDQLKNELDVMPLRVRKVATLQGLLFIFFVSLVLRSILLRRMKTAGLLDRSSIEEVLMELAKIRAVKIGRVWRLTEISKKERTIFEKMEIGVPIDASIVIKQAGV
jgi:transposase